MKRFLSVLLMVSMILSLVTVPVSAEIIEGKYENYSWNFDTSNYTLTVEGQGAITENNWNKYQTKIQTVIIGEGITEIGTEVFGKHYNISEIYFPSTLQYLGISAFLHCNKIKSIHYPGSQEQWEENVKVDMDYDYNKIFLDYEYFVFGDGFEETTVEIQEFEDIDTDYTFYDYETIDFPDYISAVTENGNVSCNIVPDETPDFSSPGNYTLSAHIEIPKGYIYEGDTNITFNVTILESTEIIGFEPISDIVCNPGITPALPDSVVAITESGTFAVSLTINTIFNVTTPGDYTIYATAIIPKGYRLKSGISSELSFTVKIKPYPNGLCGENIRWSLDANGRITFTGSGDMYEYDNTVEGKEVPWSDLDYEIKSMSFDNGITSFANDIFAGTDVSYISLPSSLNKISPATFRESALKNISVSGNTNFTMVSGALYKKDEPTKLLWYPRGLYNSWYYIDANTTEIADYAFENSLAEIIYVPSTVKKIGTLGLGNTAKLVGNASLREYAQENGNEFSLVRVDGIDNVDDITVYVGDTVELPQFVRASLETMDYVYLPIQYESYDLNPDTSKVGKICIWADVVIPDDYSSENKFTAIFYINVVKRVFNGTCGDNITWSLEDGVLTISGTGAMYDSCSWEHIDEISSVVLGDGITHIGENAFAGMAIDSLEIPSTVTSIGKGFISNTNITSITLPASVQTIADGAFLGSSVSDITIDDGNTYFKVSDSVVMDNAGKKIIYYIPGTPDTEYKIPETVEEIASFAFSGASILEFIEIPASIVKIGNDAFDGISPSLKVEKGSVAEQYAKDNGITYESKAGIIEEGTYGTISWTIDSDYTMRINGTGKVYYRDFRCENESLVKKIIIGEGITDFNFSFLLDYDAAEELYISSTVENVANHNEYNYPSLKAIYVDADNARYFSIDGVLYDDYYTRTNLIRYPDAKSGESFTIPAGVEKIADQAFRDNPYLKEIVISHDVEDIARTAFMNCIGLENFEVVSTNGEFRSENGVIHPKEIRSILFYPPSKPDEVYTVPFTVDVICDYSFYNTQYLKKVILPRELGSICEYAFANSVALEEADLPDGLVVIYKNAFENCVSLKSISIPQNITYLPKEVFRGCTSLETVVVSQNLNHIYEGVFRGCTSLDNIDLKNVEDIGDYAFYGCTGLKTADFGEKLALVYYHAFFMCTSLEEVILPETCIKIFDNAFKSCNSLKKLRFPGIKQINYNAFQNCTSLWDVEFPQTLEYIFDYGFANTALETVVLPKNQEFDYIYKYCFADCKNLKSVTIPSNVLHIKDYAFKNCTSLKEISLHKDIESIGSYAFADCCFDKVDFYAELDEIPGNLFKNMAFTEINIPSTVEKIGSSAFSGCTMLENIVIPSTVTEISSSAFHGCKSLEEISLPSSLKTLGKEAFADSGLKSLTVPGGVLDFNITVISSCEDLKELRLNLGVGKISGYYLSDCPSLEIIYVPSSVTEIAPLLFPSGISFYGQKGSYAETYANSRNINFIYPKTPITSLNAVWNGLSGSEITFGSSLDLPNSFYASTSGSSIRIEIVYEGEIDTFSLGEQTIKASFVIPDGYELASGLTNEKTLTYNIVPARISYVPNWTSLTGADLALNEYYYLPTYTIAIIENSSTRLNLTITYDCELDTSYEHTQIITATLNLPEGYALPAGVEAQKTLVFNIIDPSVSGTYENIFWSIEGGVLTVSGKGAMPDFEYDEKAMSTAPWIQYADSISLIIISDGITSVGNNSFSFLRNADRIDIPESVTSIGDYAFDGCGSNTNNFQLTLPKNLTYLGEHSLEGMAMSRIILPAGITEIKAATFYKCHNLSYVAIYGKLTKIDEEAFYGCSSLRQIEYAGTEEEWNRIEIVGERNADYLENVTISFGSISDVVLPKTDSSVKVNDEKGIIEISTNVPKEIFSEYKSVELVIIGANGNLFKSRTITSDSDLTTTIPGKGTDVVKVFIWESLKSMKPLTKVEYIRVPR